MISRCCILLFCLALTGCCASGVGCTISAAGGPVAWDGLGASPTQDPETEPAVSYPVKPRKARPVAAGDRTKPEAPDKLERERAADQAADAKLSDQLRICRNC